MVLRCGRARDFPENQLTFRDFFLKDLENTGVFADWSVEL